MRLLLSFVCIALFFALGVVATPVAAAATGDGSILVLPFSIPPGSPESWIGKGMQQDLLTDLERGTTARISAPATAPAAVDSTEALAAAREAGASFVVFGQAQYNGTEVRFTGQILDVASAKPLTSLKATGPLGDLFHLEDAIVGQTLAGLPRVILSPLAAAAMSPPSQPAAAGQQPYAPPAANADTGQQSTSDQTAPASVAPSDDSNYPATSDAYPPYAETAPLYSYDYGYGYAVPAYTYAGPYCDLYPYYGGVFGYVGGYGYGGRYNRGHDRGRGFDRGRGENAGGAAYGNRGFNIARSSSGFGRVGSFRSAAAPVSRSFGGGFHAALSSGGFHGGGGRFHGGGGHGGGGGRR